MTDASPAGAAGGECRVAVLWLGRLSRDTGGRTYLAQVAGPLARHADLTVDLHVADPDFAAPAGCGVVRHAVPERLGPYGRVLAEPLVAARLRRSYDVLLAPFANVPPTWAGPSVTVAHNVLAFGDHVREQLGVVRGFYRPRALAGALRRATIVLVVSEYLRGLLIERFPDLDAASLRVVPLGAPPARTTVPRPAAQSAPDVLVVSALWPYKRVDQAILAFARAFRDGPARLRIAGPGSEPDVKALRGLASRERVGERVEFLGNVPYEELSRLYQTSDVLLYPSEIESFGLPLLEAMAFGVPVVARRVMGVAEVGGDAPVWVEPAARVDEIAAALRLLTTETAVRQRHIAAGLARAGQFTWERTAALTAQALLDAAESPRVRSARADSARRRSATRHL